MGCLETLLDVTTVAHVTLAWLASLDAKKCGDDADKRIVLTFLTDVVGVAKYARDEC